MKKVLPEETDGITILGMAAIVIIIIILAFLMVPIAVVLTGGI